MIIPWYIGETRNVYVSVSSTTGSITISSATYTIYDTSDNSIVDSGEAGITSQVLYCSWTPTEVGNFVVDFDYTVGSETHTSRQVIEVKETM